MKRILVTDDTASMRAAAREILEPEGFEIIEACDGEEALRVFASAEPELVLLDLVMPRCSGLETLAEIRRRDGETPVVVCSGFGQERLAAEAVVSGANDFVVKPFHPFGLVAAVLRCRRKRLVPARPW